VAAIDICRNNYRVDSSNHQVRRPLVIEVDVAEFEDQDGAVIYLQGGWRDLASVYNFQDLS
jgi:hypothetical protein